MAKNRESTAKSPAVVTIIAAILINFITVGSVTKKARVTGITILGNAQQK